MRRLTPPILAGFLRPRPRTDTPIGSGIYPDFDSVPIEGDGFGGETWLEEEAQATSTAISDDRRQDSLPWDVPTYRAMLGLLCSCIGHSKSSIRILDFGGGMGVAFANLIGMLPDVDSLSHLVVDNSETCRRGAELFHRVPRIQFSPVLPQDLGGFDVCFLGSVLQYVNDYRGLLRKLAAGQPEYFFLGFTPIGEIPTFATTQ